MKNFTVSQLIKSLIMPFVTFCYMAIALGGEIMAGALYFTGYDAVRSFYFPLMIMIVGGVLPALLTLFRNIHTERYFFKRLCTCLVCYAALWLLGQIMYISILSTLLYIALGAGKVVYELLKVQDDETTGGERAVMFLSDIFIWFCLDYCLMAFGDFDTIKFI